MASHNILTSESDSSAFLPEGQQPPNEPASAPSTPPPPTTGGGSEGGFADYFDKMLQGYGEDYMKEVMAMADQNDFTITLHKPDPSGKTEEIEYGTEIIKRPVYIDIENKTYKRVPISPMDFHRAEKLRAKFQAEKDPDKVADNQIAIYKFLAACYLKMPSSEFERIVDWNQLKMCIDACNFRTLYRPQRK